MLLDKAIHTKPRPTTFSANGNASADLARAITWAGSKQSFMIARLLVDKGLQDDCYRAYGYFRWVDDAVDEITQSRAERVAFINRQRELIDRLYRNENPGTLAPEERIIADLVRNDGGASSGLQSFIHNFLAIIEFDAQRKGKFISQAGLAWYSNTLGIAVTDAIEHFVGHGYAYPSSPGRYMAATAAHTTHMLRDMIDDIADGYINIPHEYLERHGIRPEQVRNPLFRKWVQHRVQLARELFHAGKRYLDRLDDLRSKIAGYWYCARFEHVLDTIERDGYVLRAGYNGPGTPSALLQLAWRTVVVILKHAAQQIAQGVRTGKPSGLPTKS